MKTNNKGYFEINQIQDLKEINNKFKGLFDSILESSNTEYNIHIINEMLLSDFKENNYKGINININFYIFFKNKKDSFVLDKIIKGIIYSNIKTVFTKECDLFFHSIDGIIFNNCIFKDNLIFRNGIIKNDLIFRNCTFENNLMLYSCNFEGKLGIFSCEIKEKLELFYIEDLKILNISNKDNRKDEKKYYNSIELKNVYMDKEGGLFLFDNFKVGNFIYKNSTKLPENISITNVIIKERLDFIHINLGKTTFNGVKINKLYLENTTLNDCIFNGVEFPKNYKLEEGKLSNKKLKDNYRQLKFVMDKNGNITEANKFFEKEMEYEMLSLGIDNSFWKGLYNLYKKKFIGKETKDLASGIQLWFGWSFNEFGNNWLRTLFLLFLWALISVIFNILYNYFFNIKIGDILFFGGGGIPQDFFHYDIIKDYFKLFLNLLYPLYGFKKDYIDGLDNWLTLGFIIYKTIYGILLWHLIVALKRTTKR